MSEHEAAEKPTIGEFLSSVKETVKNSTDAILDMAKESLVQKELMDRRDAFLAAVSRLQDLQKEGYKLKPDVGEALDGDGKQVGEMRYSKARFEELKKNKEAIAKVEKAIAAAFGGDFSKLKEVANKQ